MPRPLFRIAMFLSSYAPLFALLAYTNRHRTAPFVTLVVIVGVGLAGLGVVLAAYSSERGPQLEVATSQPHNGDVLAYISTYLVPFFGVDLTKQHDIVLFAGFLLVLMFVYVNSEMLLVNPVLSIVGYRSFAVTDPDGHSYSLITRRTEIAPQTTIRPAQVTSYLRLEVTRAA